MFDDRNFILMKSVRERDPRSERIVNRMICIKRKDDLLWTGLESL